MRKFFLSHGQNIHSYEIEKFAHDQKLEIPIEYIKFLTDVNGGIPHKQIFNLREFDSNKDNPNTFIMIEEFLSFQQLSEAWSYVKHELSTFNLIPIADVRGGMLICCKQSDEMDRTDAKLFFYDMNFGIVKLTNKMLDFLNLLITKEVMND